MANNRPRADSSATEGHELEERGLRNRASTLKVAGSQGSGIALMAPPPPSFNNEDGNKTSSSLSDQNNRRGSQVERPAHEETSSPQPTSLRRKLHGLDIFMIGICTVIGMGFYVRTGTILHVGGPAAVVYSFFFLGVLAFMVMQGLTTMLRLWPIPGALIVFIEKFVDKEVSEVAAVLYWLAYCFSFSGLTTTIGELVEYYKLPQGWSITISVFSLLVPIAINLMPINVFRLFELAFGTIKLCLAVAMIITMNVINPKVGELVEKGDQSYSTTSDDTKVGVFRYHEGSYGGWFTAIVPCVFLASFAFVGIEGIAVTAQEVNFESPAETTSTDPEPNEEEDDEDDGRPSEDNLQNPFELASFIPFVVTAIYVWGGWIVSQNMSWNDPRLPDMQWIKPEGSSSNSSGSVFVSSTENYGKSERMPRALTGLLIVNVASTSATALYIACRTLFGVSSAIARRHRDDDKTRYLSFIRILCKTKWSVPWVSVLVSAWMSWLPFLKYFTSRTTFVTAIDVVTEMASVACLSVWALLSLATWRFYRCYKRHHEGTPDVPSRFKAIVKVDKRSWYITRLMISGASALLCGLIILFAGTITFTLNKTAPQGVAIFTIVVLFAVLTILLKCIKQPEGPHAWSRLKTGVDLRDEGNVTEIFQDLQDNMKHNSEG